MRTAIYPGTFDPITFGHLDVIERAGKIFDRIVVAVSQDSSKETLFTVEERVNQITELLKNNQKIEIDSFCGLLVEYAKRKNAQVIIRGLRAVTDFEFEMQMALMNRRLEEEVDTIFLMPNIRYTYLNSSIVREVAYLGGDVSQFVAPTIAEQMEKKFKNNTGVNA